MKEINLEDVKKSLIGMKIQYTEGDVPENMLELIKSFGYVALPITANLTNLDGIDAEIGVVVHNKDLNVDDGIYIFTVLRSGQAGFLVVKPGTISRAPLIRKVTGDITNAISGLDLPPMMPFDMVEIVAHTIAGTFMKMLIESCQIPEEYEQLFLHLYMPKFLTNVGMYFVGATKEDGTPMVYEEIANIEPMMIWRSIQKGVNNNESGVAGETTGEFTGEFTGESKEKYAGETKEIEIEKEKEA